MRDAYITAGNKLDEIVKMFMNIMTRMEEIEELFKDNGWGYNNGSRTH
jgi:hypothetical protein